MGLAASQARLLGLTARKSNIEYQGQQINQARTALSNEVMGLYEKYNDLKVPTAPSVYDYTTTIYKVDSTYENYEITNFKKITDGQYKGYYNVSLTYDVDIPKKYTYAAANSKVTAQRTQDEQGNYNYSYLNFLIGTTSYTYDEDNPGASTITKITDNYEQYPGLVTIMEALGLTDGTFFMLTMNNTQYYTPQIDLDATAFEKKGDKYYYSGTYSFDYQGTVKQSKTAGAIAQMKMGSNGRPSEMYVVASDDAPDLVGNTYSITTTTIEDEAKYEDAMNKYNYDKALYEKEVEKINKETQKLQAEDKSLELKLNQLDTEQNAIKTEMESVSKVIEDTIDTVFKTYNS